MKSVIFDLDGTLGNTLPLCIAAFREVIEPHLNRPLSDEEIIATFGPTEEGTISVFLPDHVEAGTKQYLRSYERLHSNWPEPFQGIHEILRFLKDHGAFIGLITGKGPVSASMTLERYGFTEFFDSVKPGAASGPIKDVGLEEMIAEFSLERDQILYVGDSPTDITFCRQCRIKIAAVAWAPTTNRQKLKDLEPDYLFDTVEEFSGFLKRQSWG